MFQGTHVSSAEACRHKHMRQTDIVTDEGLRSYFSVFRGYSVYIGLRTVAQKGNIVVFMQEGLTRKI